MIPLRDKVPKRRAIPTKKPKKNWRAHKQDLKEDFNGHCAYCYSYDGFRHTFYEVDHFVPKLFFSPLGNIGLTQYDNLVYACKFCNNNKRDKWPSQSETIYNDGKKGFVDPCTDEVEKHLGRTDDGAIMWKSELGKWMFSEAFKFDERLDVLKVLWNLNRLRTVISESTQILSQYSKNSKTYKDIKSKLDVFYREYHELHQELMEFYS